MIGTLMRISWLNLKRDRIALALTFIMPIVFFTIFAWIFGNMGTGGGGEERSVIVVDEDQTKISGRFVQAIDEQKSLKVVTTPRATEENPDPAPYTRETATAAVRAGDYSVALIIPEGFGDEFGTFVGDSQPVQLIYDASNPYARFSTAGLLQAAAMTTAPDILMQQGLGYLEQYGGGLTDEQQNAVDTITPYLRGERDWEELADEETADDQSATEREVNGEDASDAGDAGFAGLVRVEAIDVRGEEYDMVAYYAAGISVMFLLFSMAGAGSSILEEEETGTLERLLSSNVSMTSLLTSNWLFFVALGFAQVAVMFIWAALVFDLDLLPVKRLVGAVVMTLVTCAAAAAFGIIFATACRSRAQLGGLSTIVILIMSALGGSMVPKFVAPDVFNLTSLFTFNGWALDGYLKVFWFDDPAAGLAGTLRGLAPQLTVLIGMTIVFLFVARLLARRWETA
ncbi:MAG: ABC transporter permease [Planctomycetota bacterium]|nr:ABC transporter permease [Planctomycetota bacterium]